MDSKTIIVFDSNLVYIYTKLSKNVETKYFVYKTK